MKELTYVRATDAAEAVAAVAADPDARFLAAGTNLVDHLKLGVATPGTVVDVSRLPLAEVEPLDGGGVRIGTNVRNTDLAVHPLVRHGFPAVSRALLAGASGQIRNQATTGGNLLQRTRCVYFQDVTTPCNKREPGSGCSAIGGFGRYDAILGASEACVATHPSDLAVALAALEARVVVLGPDGERRVPMTELHRLPGHHPERDTTLAHGELVTHVELTGSDLALRSTYVKVRDRASYAFALVSVAAGLELDGDGEDAVVRDVRLAWGGVAHKPWRATAAEDVLRGRPLDAAAVREAVDAETRDATTTTENAYKPAMLRGATTAALAALAGRDLA
ncbi:xanthine dehydrogenase family protein subunit M [Nocardioides sp. CFH 31398]|uniref:FAD binding domain-containing protein n=1 Tax=Nocardioides sp. CFH 31398 TaxID=2919579 RepID=UPI001F05839E|nr:xanthine dehydrogenase family protein subunit M [Nocardioides sp. CFH 31398]MCH1866232.1 xanthine dehydrogenase family protein subunit M [Nocardioides sp. CFH 31398]